MNIIDRIWNAHVIKSEIKRRFGWRIRFIIDADGSFHWEKISGKDRYDLYPGMSKKQADAAVIKDILRVIRQSIPNAQITDYEQSGKMHYPKG